MDRTTSVLTVFFEEPFWVGVWERIADGKLSACKITFGAEPKDFEIYDFILKKYDHLMFSPAVTATVKESPINPKRMQREIKRQIVRTGIGTKSQQALKLQQEQRKTDRKQITREMREAEKQRRFELKQQKKRAKHRGK